MRKNDLASLGFFLINPTIGLLYAIVFGSKDKYITFFLISLYFSLIAFSMTPYITMDIVRYYMVYETLKELSISDIYATHEYNLGILTYMKIIASSGLKKEFIPFFTTFISYNLFLYILYSNSKKNDYDNSREILLLVAFILSSLFIASASGLRNGVATSLVLLGVYQLQTKEGLSISGVIFITLSLFIHVYVSVIIVLYLCSLNGLSVRSLRALVLFSFVFSSISLDKYIIDFLGNIIPNEFYLYFINEFVDNEVNGVGSDKSFINQLIFSVTKLPIWLFSVYVIFSTDNGDRIHKLGLLLSCLTILFFKYPVLFGRYSDVLIMVCLLVILSNCVSNESFEYKRAHTHLLYFLAFSIIGALWSIYRFRYMYIDSVEYIISPFIFTFFNNISIPELRRI